VQKANRAVSGPGASTCPAIELIIGTWHTEVNIT